MLQASLKFENQIRSGLNSLVEEQSNLNKFLKFDNQQNIQIQ